MDGGEGVGQEGGIDGGLQRVPAALVGLRRVRQLVSGRAFGLTFD